MSDQFEDRYCFQVDWYDSFAQLTRKYQLLYYTSDTAIEMFDMKNHKTFLKRSKLENIRLEDLYLGSTIHVYSRPLHIVDYGDDFTRKKLSAKKERTLGLIKPDAMAKMGQIIEHIQGSGFLITRLKMCHLSRADSFEFYKEHRGKPFLDNLLELVTSGPMLAMELMAENAVVKWRDALGPTDSSAARSQAPSSIRAKFGKDVTMNACHGSDSPASAARELEFFFPSSASDQHKTTAQFTDCTCCVIKPHAVLEGLSGRLISAIQEAGFEISALEMFYMERANAEEFYEIYKGVVQEYYAMVDELSLGPCIAMEIRAQDAPKAFREMVGPADPEIARHIRPRTLRAQYGKDKVKNAVHCSDLPEDGLLEVEYFFKILSH